MKIKRTEQEIEAKRKWLEIAVKDEENQDTVPQVRLYSYINFIDWLFGEKDGL